MKNAFALLLVSTFLFCASGSEGQESDGRATPKPEGLSTEEFATLHKSLQPHEEGAWGEIHWQVTLVEGREVAILEDKPLFVWGLDGHPLGNC